MNILENPKLHHEFNSKEVVSERYEKVRANIKKTLIENLEKLDRLIIKEKKMLKDSKTLKEKIERMKYIQEKDTERALLRSSMFEIEDFMDELVNRRINKI